MTARSVEDMAIFASHIDAVSASQNLQNKWSIKIVKEVENGSEWNETITVRRVNCLR